MNHETDAVIIGAGLSGLYSAYLLSQQGVTVPVLEARNRVGGRIHGLALANGDTLDLGPSWFWPHQPEVAALCRALGLSIAEQYTLGDALYQASTHSSIERFAGAGMPTSYRIEGGVSHLIHALHQRLDNSRVYVNQPARQVTFENGVWQVDTPVGSHRARHLILAAPPRVALGTTGVARHVSAGLQNALQNTPTWMAAQAKFVAHYAVPFWRQQGLAGDAFSRVGPLSKYTMRVQAPNAVLRCSGFWVSTPGKEQHLTVTLCTKPV